IAVRVEAGTYGWAEFVGAGFSWSKWQESNGTLLRILLMEQIAVTRGYFEDPFPGRVKREPPEVRGRPRALYSCRTLCAAPQRLAAGHCCNPSRTPSPHPAGPRDALRPHRGRRLPAAAGGRPPQLRRLRHAV